MRVVAVVVLTIFLGPLAVSAQEKTPSGQATKAPPAITHAESTVLMEASRKKAEELEKARDRKMKNAARSICIGC